MDPEENITGTPVVDQMVSDQPAVSEQDVTKQTPVYSGGKIVDSDLFFTLKKHPKFSWLSGYSEAEFKNMMTDPDMVRTTFDAIHEQPDLSGTIPGDYKEFYTALKKKILLALEAIRTIIPQDFLLLKRLDMKIGLGAGRLRMG